MSKEEEEITIGLSNIICMSIVNNSSMKMVDNDQVLTVLNEKQLADLVIDLVSEFKTLINK